MFTWKGAVNAALLSCCVVLVGCKTAPMPIASNFATSEQYKLRSASHWNTVAQDTVTQTLQMLGRKGLPVDTPVYVQTTDNPSTFEANFHEFLLTQLVRKGINVQAQPNPSDLVLRYQVQKVVHRGSLPPAEAGRHTMLGAGIWALHGLRDQHLDVLMAIPTMLGLGRDWHDSRTANGPTHSEVVITTSALQHSAYIARYTDTYYIQDADLALFGAQNANNFESRTMKVVSQ